MVFKYKLTLLLNDFSEISPQIIIDKSKAISAWLVKKNLIVRSISYFKSTLLKFSSQGYFIIIYFLANKKINLIFNLNSFLKDLKVNRSLLENISLDK